MPNHRVFATAYWCRPKMQFRSVRSAKPTYIYLEAKLQLSILLYFWNKIGFIIYLGEVFTPQSNLSSNLLITAKSTKPYSYLIMGGISLFTDLYYSQIRYHFCGKKQKFRCSVGKGYQEMPTSKC